MGHSIYSLPSAESHAPNRVAKAMFALMSDDANAPLIVPADVDAAITRAQRDLRDVHAALDQATGGAPPRAVLAELAQALAADLASGFFDVLPMELARGRVVRGAGLWGSILPGRSLPHRVILARFLSATPPHRTGVGYKLTIARIALLALGADGVLRTGAVTEQLTLQENHELTLEPLAWDDPRIRRVPTRPIRLARWQASGDARSVAPPTRVIEALVAIATQVAQDSKRDLALLQRFL